MPKDINCMNGRCRFSDKIHESVMAKFGSPYSVIELGCGQGLNLKKFTSSSRVVGIDPFEPNILAAKKNIPNAELYMDCHLKLKDFMNNEFDLGFTCSVLDHIENYELALDEMIRACKHLFLLEPMIEGEHRQSTLAETSCPDDTWYWNYPKILSDKNLEFSIEHTPLYAQNSGPLYHSIYINCES